MLEQFIQVLPAGRRDWVKRHRPKTLAEVASLMENYVAAGDLASLTPRTSASELRTPTPNGGWARRRGPGLLNWLLPFSLPIWGPEPSHRGGAEKGPRLPRTLGQGVQSVDRKDIIGGNVPLLTAAMDRPGLHVPGHRDRAWPRY